MATRYFLQEQVRFKIAEGYPSVLEKIQQEDVVAAIGQKINSLLKLQYFSETLSIGDSIPTGLMLATYQSTATTTGKKFICNIPVQPISLPRNMGVYMVDYNEDFSNPFIPFQTGQSALLSGQPLISDLLGQVGYEVVGNKIYGSPDITVFGKTTVYFRLLVLDISSYDDYTDLPIPAEYAQQIIDEVYKSFLPEEQIIMQGNQMKPQPIKEIGK